MIDTFDYKHQTQFKKNNWINENYFRSLIQHKQ